MAQNINVEMAPKLRKNIEVLESVIENARKGMENTKEMCDEQGADKLKKSCESAGEGVEALLQSMEELVEVLDRTATQYERTDAALN